MKKLFAMTLALCLLCVSAAALAEKTAATEATKVELDGFTLELTRGELYQTNEKTVNGIYIMVYPLYASGDTAQNYSFIWAGSTFDQSVEGVQDELPGLEESVRTELEAHGISMDSFVTEEVYEATLNGTDCIALDYNINMSVSGQTLTVYGREIILGSMGYTITITALTSESRDEITDQLAQSLNF